MTNRTGCDARRRPHRNASRSQCSNARFWKSERIYFPANILARLARSSGPGSGFRLHARLFFPSPYIGGPRRGAALPAKVLQRPRNRTATISLQGIVLRASRYGSTLYWSSWHCFHEVGPSALEAHRPALRCSRRAATIRKASIPDSVPPAEWRLLELIEDTRSFSVLPEPPTTRPHQGSEK